MRAPGVTIGLAILYYKHACARVHRHIHMSTCAYTGVYTLGVTKYFCGRQRKYASAHTRIHAHTPAHITTPPTHRCNPSESRTMAPYSGHAMVGGAASIPKGWRRQRGRGSSRRVAQFDGAAQQGAEAPGEAWQALSYAMSVAGRGSVLLLLMLRAPALRAAAAANCY